MAVTRIEEWASLKVADLRDHDSVCWHEELVREIFQPCDVDLILSMSLCASWPQDKLIWHYQSQGSFIDRFAYHMLIDVMHSTTGLASMHDNGLWRAVWCCNVPPHIKVFGSRAGTGAPPLLR